MGTWKIPTDVCAAQVDQALEVGFSHIDTAQGKTLDWIVVLLINVLYVVRIAYRNETETGFAIKDSGLARGDVWLTTKWSGVDGKGPRQSIEESLQKVGNLYLNVTLQNHKFAPKLGLKYVDLLLIHAPSLCRGDIPYYWSEMEKIRAFLSLSLQVSLILVAV